ncbi:uncharacterized protein K444DRAFT_155495 [Hyaloscypha bicolor E]|uniref:Uncharacterized protein n=1 Tax=Hyaloscypha bicolor E TaxID=1095630 RepID=A0A2J6TS87_9HELO|nr:uncharacterized protein K444DRAFT_155495 [Hyaloscypha bicolor E]PMD65880.1 hypothetical protein K444DRAFT_155495 [Hyaloscypha bicolor E]
MTPPRCIRVVVANVQRRRRISSPIKKPLLCGGTWFRKLTGRRGASLPGHRSLRSNVDVASGQDNSLHVRLRASWSSNFGQWGCNMAARVFEIAGRQAGRQAVRQSADWRRGGALSARFKDGLVETSTVPNNSQKRNPELRDLHKLCVCIYAYNEALVWPRAGAFG